MLRLVLLFAAILPAFGAHAQAPTFTSTEVTTGTYGTPYIYNITTDPGLSGDRTISLATPVPGLTLVDHGDGTAVLSGTPTGAGTFPVSITVTDAIVFALSSTQDFDLVVAKATLTVTADNQTRPYGSANPTLTFSYSGFVGSDTEGDLDNQKPHTSTLATTGTDAGDVAITLSADPDNNYAYDFHNAVLTITKVMLQARADDKTRPYGSADVPFTISYSGFVNSDTEASLDATKPTANTLSPAIDAGTYAIKVTGGVDTNYDFNRVDGSLIVTRVTLTITADAQTKVYGDANPSLTFSFAGFVNGDVAIDTPPTISVTGVDQSTAVGSYPITLSGGSDTNYNLALNDNTLTITRASLTITAQGKTRPYGAPNPPLTVTYSGFVNGESENTPGIFTHALDITTAPSTAAVGSYGIIPSAATADNYNISFAQGTLVISKAVLVATADDQTRTYGALNPTFTVTYTGFLNGDDVGDITPGTATSPTGTTAAGIGTYAIKPAKDESAANYSFTYVDGTLTITKATLTATAQPATRTYGATDPTFSISYTGFMNGDTQSAITTPPSAAPVSTILSDVGPYDINLTGGAAPNYIFAYVKGTLTITQATVNAKADNKSKVYGDANPSPTITYTGFKNGQTAAILDVVPYSRPTATINATSSSGVGTYSIDVAGGNHLNYTFTYTSGTLTVTKATLLAIADNKTKVYGDNLPVFTATYSGFVGSDTPSVINTPPTMNTNPLTNSQSAVGTYTIEIKSGADDNYAFTYQYGTMTITKATLLARPNNQSRAYGGNIASYPVSYSGFAPGQNESVIDTKATAKAIVDATHDVSSTTDVGSYQIIASGAIDDNYDFNYQPGTLTINKASLTATADAKTRLYGAANPTYTITYTGFQNGETEAVLDDPKPVASTAPTVTPTSSVGLYDITITPATDNNYQFVYVSAKLTIAKAPLTITADNFTRPYSTANPTFTYHTTGLLNGDPASVVTAVQFDTPAVVASPVGTYSITPKNGVATNYALSYVAGTLTIIKANPTVTWNAPAGIVYGTALSATQLNATANAPGTFVYNPANGAILNAGIGQILTTTFTPADLTNFNVVAGVTVSISVSKASPTITWATPAAITYGTALSATQLNATASIPGTFTYTPPLGTILNAGASQQLKVDFHPTDAANYLDASVTRQITVNKQTPVVTWPNPANISYGTPLGATQLNATFNVAGTATYIPGVGTVLPTGSNQVISVNFTPTGADAVNYSATTGTALITVIKATPVITWANPADITYGTPLGATQLNASTPVAGTFVYNPVAGTVLAAGDGQTLSVSFTPTDGANYNSVPAKTATINVKKANPPVTWNAPAAITYGTALSATQLNATSTVAGTFNYSPTIGTVLNAGAGQTLSTTFTPTDVANYNTVITNNTITVNKATPVVTWTSPAQITYGTQLGPTQQNASADVPGVFEYNPVPGTVLTTGSNQTISVKFTPTETANYNTVLNKTTTITVIKATPVITWATPLPIKVGVALTSTQLNASSNVTGSFVYTPAAGTNFAVDGSYTLHAAFTPTDPANYNGVPDTQVQLTVSSKDNPVITWADPSAITYGAALDGTQLNATASVAGTFSYNPAIGTKLNANPGQTLSVTFTPTDGVNYNAVSKSVLIDVNKATLTATATNRSRAYGANNPTLPVTLSGFVNGDNASVVDTAPTATCAAVASDPALSTFPIIPANGADNNYTFNYVNGTLTINKATLTAKADSQTRQYGAFEPDFTISYTGFVNGDNATNISPPTGTTDALITSSVGNYTITLGGGSAANYNFNLQTGTLTIIKAPLFVITDDQTKVYGAPNPTLTIRYLGFKNGDTKASISEPTASTVAATAPVGNYPINLTGGSGVNYSLNFFPGTLSVTKAPLTAKAEDKTRGYGLANPANKIIYTGFVNGDSETAVNTPPTINGPAATPSSNVDVYPITLSGGFATNYDLTLQNGALTITKASLTARADNQSRAYGQTNPAFTITYSGFLVGDDATDITEPAGSTAATPLSNAGTYPITLAGGVATNYSFTYQGGTLTVTKATLNATANDATRNYGQANPTFGITYAGFLNGDDAGDITPPTPGTIATPASNVGNYAINLTGGSAPNYTLALASGNLTVSKATLTAKADNKTRLYGASNPSNSITYTGFLNGDDAGDISAPSFDGPNANASSPVGNNYTISLIGGSAMNYNIIPQAGTLTITQAPLTAKADDKSRTYGGTNPSFTITYTGFVNGENASNITVPTASTTAVATSNTGTYPITLSGTTGNYAFTFVSGTLTVSKATVAVTADNKTRAYGAANPTFTLSYSGLMNSENSSVINVLPVGATTAIATTPVQNVPITVSGGSDNNYTFTYASGTLTITKAPLTATADDKSRPYGSANPANTITYTGFQNGETAAVITEPTVTTLADGLSPVGTYSISITGGSATNYQLTLVDGTLTVDKAIITVTAADQSRTYGAPNPSLTINYTGFVNGQDVPDIDTAPVASTPAIATSPVATYPISASGGDDSNYDFSYVDGTLTINKADLTATADTKTTTYGTIPELTITYTGFMNAEDASVLDTAPTTSTTATLVSDTGTYPVTLSASIDNNYNVTTVDAILTIVKAPLTAKADDQSRIIGFVNPPLTITYSGFMNNETESVLNTAPTASTVANTASGPGDYSITVAGGSDDHYDFVYQPGNLSVVLNTPPVVNNFNIDINEDTSLPITLQLFIDHYADEPGGTISNVKIVTLPTNGVLYKAGLERVAAGEELQVTGGQLGELSYLPNKDYAGNDSFSWNVFDGTFVANNNATVTIKIKAVNDPPVLSNIESTKLSYNPGDAPVNITEGIIVNDVDDDFAFSATVSIDQETFSSGDKLAVTLPSGSPLKLTYNESTGELILDGKDTRINYQSLLREITFSSPVNGDAVIGDKLVNIFVNDSLSSSNIVSRTISISQVFPELDIVNAFTPNGDGVNDGWDFVNLQSYSVININVYDMNGNKVFNCTTDDCVWDGTFKGKALPAGPYAYTIDLDNKKRTYNGIVTILK